MEQIMQWYRASINLKTDPKRARLQKALGIGAVEAIGYIHLLYSFTAQFAETGDLKKYSPEEIEAACEWQGADKVLFSNFMTCGFIDEKPDGFYKVHGFYEANTQHLKDLSRKRRERKVRGQSKDGPGTVLATSHTNESNETNKIYTDIFYVAFEAKYGETPKPSVASFVNLAKLIKSGVSVESFKMRVNAYFKAPWPKEKDLQGLLSNWDKFAKAPQVEYKGASYV